MAWVADLTWGDTQLEDGLRVERKVGASDWAPIATLPPDTVAYTDEGPLTEGVQYGYRVVAFNSAGETPSNEVFGVPLAAPAAVTGLTLRFRRV